MASAEFRLWEEANQPDATSVSVTADEWADLSGPWGPSWVNVAEQRVELGRRRFVPIVIVNDTE